MKQWLIACGLLLFPCAVHAETLPNKSLFLAPAEAAQLEAARARQGEHVVRDPADLRLDAIMYYEPDRWSVWLQGQQWTPQTVQADIKILSVTESEVQLSYRPDRSQQAREITLKPHQTYQAATGRIAQSVMR